MVTSKTYLGIDLKGETIFITAKGVPSSDKHLKEWMHGGILGKY